MKKVISIADNKDLTIRPECEVDHTAEENRKRLEEALHKNSNPWGLSPKAIEATKAAMTMLSTKNGLHAKIPLICKAEDCPYSESCSLLMYDLAPRGEYCPTELAQIDLRCMGYSQDIDLSNASFTDRTLMSELVTLDIMLERCKALMAKEGTPVIDMAIGIDKDGNEIRQAGVSKAWEAYEKMSKKRDATYQLLMLTRKDKKANNSDDDGISTSQLLRDVINNEEIFK